MDSLNLQELKDGEGLKEENTITSVNLTSEDNEDDDDEEEEEDWEKEADELYQWSQQLSIDDSTPITPG